MAAALSIVATFAAFAFAHGESGPNRRRELEPRLLRALGLERAILVDVDDLLAAP